MIIRQIVSLAVFFVFTVILPLQAVAKQGASARTVVLRSLEGTTTLTGELVEFEGGNYTLRTVMGLMVVDGYLVTCEGEGCPTINASKKLFRYNVAPTADRTGFLLTPISKDAYELDIYFNAFVIAEALEVAAQYWDRPRRISVDAVRDQIIASFMSPSISTSPSVSYLNDPVVHTLVAGRAGLLLTIRPNDTDANIVLAQVGEMEESSLVFVRLREIARQAALEVFDEATNATCEFTPRPKEISPSFTVSFGIYSGAEFTFEATYDVASLCADN